MFFRSAPADPTAARRRSTMVARWNLDLLQEMPTKLRRLHRDDRGAAQSLAFVLTFPALIMALMLIVQVSQIMIGVMVIEYAAIATARAASVWIPADLGGAEGANTLIGLTPTGRVDGAEEYLVAPEGAKYELIARTAKVWCSAIAPSRNVGVQSTHAVRDLAMALARSTAAIAPIGVEPRLVSKFERKLAYSAAFTRVEARVVHRHVDPPLATHRLPDDEMEFRPGEVGDRDIVIVAVEHDMALLPGPGRLLARRAAWTGADPASDKITRREGFETYPLRATATAVIEGEKSVLPVRHDVVQKGL